MTIEMQPRLLRQCDAPKYLGMSEATFNKIVRPCITTIRYGRAIFYSNSDHSSTTYKSMI